MRELLEAVVTRVDGCDAIATLELGSGREAAGKVGKLAVLIGTFGMRVESTAIAAEAVVVEAVPAPEPAPVKKQDGEGSKR